MAVLALNHYNLTNYLYLPLQVDRSDVQEVGLALCHSDKIRKLSFTGSTPVGKWLMRESASTVKKVPSLCTFIHLFSSDPGAVAMFVCLE